MSILYPFAKAIAELPTPRVEQFFAFSNWVIALGDNPTSFLLRTS